jgi:hypothetical protein
LYTQKAKGENDKMKIQKTQTKIVTTMTSLVIGLMLMSTTTMIPNVGAASISHHIGYAPPILSTSMNQEIINTALTIPELQNWSHNWQYVGMSFLGNNKVGSADFQWQYAIVNLKAPSSSAPVSCNNDWLAWVEIDMTTMKIVRSAYPTMESHICKYSTATAGLGDNHTWSNAPQDDVGIMGHSYYGNYAEIALPSFSSTIYHDLNNAYIELLVNAFFDHGTGCSPTKGCIEQTGWLITNGTSTCVGCTVGVGKHAIIYVDESVNHNELDYDTGLTWTNGAATTLYGEIDCAYTFADYGITYNNGTNMGTKTTSIPCSTSQSTNNSDDSVFFENAANETSSKWSGDLTSTVSATNAQEYKDSTTNLVLWSSSSNFDTNCYGHISTTSQVITGSLASGTTATWSSLNKQPVAMSGCH